MIFDGSLGFATRRDGARWHGAAGQAFTRSGIVKPYSQLGIVHLFAAMSAKTSHRFQIGEPIWAEIAKRSAERGHIQVDPT